MTRKIIIPMRATPEERTLFHDMARANGHHNLSDWFRRMAYSTTLGRNDNINIGKNDNSCIEQELQELRRQLQAVGNNLNQIAFRLNAGDSVDPGPVLADVQSVISDIQVVIKCLRPRTYRRR